MDFGIAEEIHEASKSSSSAFVLSKDSIESELNDELNDLFAISLATAPEAMSDETLLFFATMFSDGPVEEPELPDRPTADGRGR